MTASPRPGTDLVPYADLTLTGPLSHITRAITAARSSGQLIAATPPRPVSTTDHRYRAQLRVHATQDRTPDVITWQLDASIRWSSTTNRRTHHRHHTSPAAVVALVVVVAVAVAGFTIGYLSIGAALLAKALTVLVGLAVVVAALLMFLPSSGRHHCPGCRH